MNIKRNIIFSPECRKKAGVLITENVPIRMRVIYAGNRIDFSTGYRIDAEKWDADAQRVKNGCTNKLKQSSAEINADLSQYFADIQSIFKQFVLLDVIPTPDQLREKFKTKYRQSDEPVRDTKKEESNAELFTVFDKFVKENGILNNWTIATYEKFKAVKSHLTTFNPLLTFDDLTDSGLNNYVIFLRDKQDLRNSTIGKQLGFLKWFLRWSTKKGYNKNMAFEMFKPEMKNTPKKVIFLTWDELTQLRNFDIPGTKQYLERVRDVFLFLCFTGLRYSDVFNLRWSDVKNDYLEITTVKTADSLRIELNDHSRAIIEKYRHVHFENGKVLPVITNQKMNDYLKELAEMAGINEPIRETYYRGNKRVDEITPKYALLGTHAGRRTFICNALSLGIQANVVMKWTGHSDYKAMKPYIDIADDIKATAMEKFNKI